MNAHPNVEDKWGKGDGNRKIEVYEWKRKCKKQEYRNRNRNIKSMQEIKKLITKAGKFCTAGGKKYLE